MNRQRRSQIKQIQRQLSDLADQIRSVAEDEEEYRDNMPENLMGSEKYDLADAAIDVLNSVAEEVDSQASLLDDAM